ncbi:MAG: DegT/DnrJ/EryC1/StrS family aminotransferase [Bryobacteraceae bacterium]
MGRYQGRHSEALEDSIRSPHAVDCVLACSSRICGVELALRTLGISADHELVVAGYDCIGKFRPITALGATSILAEVRPDGSNLALDSIDAAIGSEP